MIFFPSSQLGIFCLLSCVTLRCCCEFYTNRNTSVANLWIYVNVDCVLRAVRRRHSERKTSERETSILRLQKSRNENNCRFDFAFYLLRLIWFTNSTLVACRPFCYLFLLIVTIRHCIWLRFEPLEMLLIACFLFIARYVYSWVLNTSRCVRSTNTNQVMINLKWW